MDHYIVEFGSAPWLLGLTILIALVVLTVAFSKVLSPQSLRRFEIVWAWILTSCFLFENGAMVYTDAWSLQWSLPLQLCSLSGLLAIYSLFSNRSTFFPYLLLWGISGGFHSLITPEMTLGNEPAFIITYHIWHSSIIIIPIYLFSVREWSLPNRTFLKVFVGTNVLFVLVGLLDALIGANYMYVIEPPAVDNPFVQGGFPYHIIMFELAGIVHFGLIAFVFGRWQKNKEKRPLLKSTEGHV